MLVSGRGAAIAGAVFFAGGIWLASEWWEKGWATHWTAPTISPNGCYRLEKLKPFWVLPAIFHRRAHPEKSIKPQWFPNWGYPGFYRLYDHRNGHLISETGIYDLASASGRRVNWGNHWGHEVTTGNILIGHTLPDCVSGGR